MAGILQFQTQSPNKMKTNFASIIDQYRFERIIWVSNTAKQYWLPKIVAISNRIRLINIIDVINGDLDATHVRIRPNRLVFLSKQLVRRGIFCHPIMENHLSASFRSRHADRSYKFLDLVVAGSEYFKIAKNRIYYEEHTARILTRSESNSIYQAYLENAELLKKSATDKDTKMFSQKELSRLIFLFSLDCNPMPFLPCGRSACSCNEMIYSHLDRVSCRLNNELADGLKSLLAMPFSWSSLHGIAMVKTPIFSLSYDDIWRKQICSVNLNNDYYPAHSASVEKHPYNPNRRAKVTSSKNYFKGIAVVDKLQK